MTDSEHQELRVISSTPVIVGEPEAVTQPDLPRAFNGYQTGAVDALIADLSRRIRELASQVAAGRDREAVLQTQIGQREEKIRALREERDKAAHDADNPGEAVGSAAQQVVNAARADAKRTLDEAGKRRDQLLAQGEKAVEDAKARAAETTAEADETARRTVEDAKAKADHLLQEADEHTAAARAQGEQLIRDAQGQAERIIAEATAKADEQEKREQDARDSYADIRARLVELAKAMGEVK